MEVTNNRYQLLKKGRVMKKLGYLTRRTNGINKYHVKELQYADIQEYKRKELAELDGQPF